jgi:hypothetical protein
VFHADVAKVDRDVAYVANYTHMLQVFVSNVLSIFSDVCYKYVYLDIAYVLYICCKYFYLDVAYVCNCFSNVFHVFLHIIQTHILNVLTVSYICCNYFIWIFQK